MTQISHYKPAKGARVLKPGGTPVAVHGELLPSTPYFARLIADGDLVPVAPAKQSNTKSANTSGSKTA